jgi:mannose-6-phosphate isomerase-like protein (cupin superfamily)
MHALHPDVVPEENWEGNPFRTLLPAEMGQGLEIYRLTVTGANPHHHDSYDQVYVIESGRGVMQIGEETREVGPGWLIYIPRGQRHSLAPLGGAPVVLYSIVHHQP